MDVGASLPLRSSALPHLLFPHKNSEPQRGGEASEGRAGGRVGGAPPCSVCFKPLFGEETFIGRVIYERPDSPENESVSLRVITRR